MIKINNRKIVEKTERETIRLLLEINFEISIEEKSKAARRLVATTRCHETRQAFDIGILLILLDLLFARIIVFIRVKISIES